MAKSYTNMSTLKAAIQQAMNNALREATEDSKKNLQENVDFFYTAPEGSYKRTGQFKASPQIDEISYNGDSAVSQISINTSTQYYPAGRDTATIYGYAEDNRLLGYGGFWRETLYETQNNIEKAFGKRFKIFR